MRSTSASRSFLDSLVECEAGYRGGYYLIIGTHEALNAERNARDLFPKGFKKISSGRKDRPFSSIGMALLLNMFIT